MKKVNQKKLSLNKETLANLRGGVNHTIISPRDTDPGTQTCNNTCGTCPSKGLSYCGNCN